MILVLLNTDYLRDFGATDVPRNSPHLVYLMVSGRAVWLLFAWAWLFAQVVVRDRTAGLHEVVLSAPVSLPALLAGRYVGALGLACVLSLSTGIGFMLVPPLGALGVFPPDAIGPQPFFAIGHSLLILTLPSAAGLGALFLCAAIRTRALAGPFACAAAVMLIWMVAMVVVRGGDANPALATLLDPSAFAEAEEQANAWTPREKAVGVLQITGTARGQPALLDSRRLRRDRRRHPRAPGQPGGGPRPRRCRGHRGVRPDAGARGVDRDGLRDPRRVQPVGPDPLLRAVARTVPAGAVRAGAAGPRADPPRGGGPRGRRHLCAFFVVVNNELGVTTYPPAEVGVPPSVTLSEFSGWAPWLSYVLTADLFKLAVAGAIVALAWLAWPRGTALTVPLRWQTGLGRLVGGAGALAAAAVALAIGVHTVLHEGLVGMGGYESAAAETARDAAWEARWWAAG